jgi:hypothetical protein
LVLRSPYGKVKIKPFHDLIVLLIESFFLRHENFLLLTVMSENNLWWMKRMCFYMWWIKTIYFFYNLYLINENDVFYIFCYLMNETNVFYIRSLKAMYYSIWWKEKLSISVSEGKQNDLFDELAPMNLMNGNDVFVDWKRCILCMKNYAFLKWKLSHEWELFLMNDSMITLLSWYKTKSWERKTFVWWMSNFQPISMNFKLRIVKGMKDEINTKKG